MKWLGVPYDTAYMMEKRIEKNPNFRGSDYYNPDELMAQWDKYKIIFNFGGRGIGKTYSGKKLVINKFLRALKKGEVFKFAWVRRTESALDKLKNNGGAGFFEQSLLDQKKVSVKVVAESIYMKRSWEEDEEKNWKHVGTLFALQSYGKWKGNQFQDYTLIITDELVKAKAERNMFDNVDAFVNTLENIVRLRQDVRVLVYANTVGELEDIRDMFDFLPRPANYGIYKFPHLETIMIYLPATDEWKRMRSTSMAGRFAKNMEAFENVAGATVVDRSELIVPKSIARMKKQRLFSLITSFDKVYHIFSAGGYIVASQGFYEKVGTLFAILPRYATNMGVYNSDVVNQVKEMYNTGVIKYTNVMEMTAFRQDLIDAGIIR